MAISATISKIIPFSCVDGPGNRLVIFMQGCNFNCVTCHNPHTINQCNHCGICVDQCPTKALSVKTNACLDKQVVWQSDLCVECDQCTKVCPHLSSPKVRRYQLEEILSLIRENQLFLTGITVSGGEASLQLPFIRALFNALKNDAELKRLTCLLDTNGSLNEAAWLSILDDLDGAMIDLKAWQKEVHQRLTGKYNHRVISSISLLANANKLAEVRLLCIPNVTDYEQHIDELANYLLSLKTPPLIRLNAFQHHGVIGEALSWPSATRADLERLAQQLIGKGLTKVQLPSVFY